MRNEAMTRLCPEIPFRLTPGNLSDDCWMGESTVDIPTNWFVSGCVGRSNYHHCDAPIFDAIQPEKLKKLVPMLATYTAVMICGNRDHFIKLSQELEKVAADWLEKEKNYIAGRAAINGIKKIDVYWKAKAFEIYYLGRMQSFNRFYPGIVTPHIPEHWADDFFKSLPDRELTDAEKEADSIRYSKIAKRIPFSQTRVPVSKRDWRPSCHESMWALISPERSVLEVIRLFDSFFTLKTSDEAIMSHLEYFRFLEEYGYIEKVK